MLLAKGVRWGEEPPFRMYKAEVEVGSRILLLSPEVGR